MVPGKSIGGVKLGMTRASVEKLGPLGRKKPTTRTGDGKHLFHTYATAGLGSVLVIAYSGAKRTSKRLVLSELWSVGVRGR